jgi:3-oxoacyl-[acyl-carrier protein] reductase
MTTIIKPLQNKVALVTGGAGGIGSAICKKLAEEGASVIITYNSNAEKAENLLNILRGPSDVGFEMSDVGEALPTSDIPNPTSNSHAIFHAPTTDINKLNALSDFIKTKYGKLDILVNNAGITTQVPHNDLDALTDEWIDKILQTNVRGTFAMIRACKDLLEINPHLGSSLVVNISSIAAVSGIGSNVIYCASKAAVDSITRSLARALAPKIRVVSVSPGWVLGEYAKSADPAFLKLQEDLTPLSKLATPEDVANTVFALAAYLTFTTGSVIPVDGGRLLK